MNYKIEIDRAIAKPNQRVAAIKAHKLYLVWQQQPSDRKLQKRFLRQFYRLAIEF